MPRFGNLPVQTRRLVMIEAAAMIAFIGWVDYVTGWELSLFTCYAFPIAFVVQKTDRRLGFFAAFLCACAWYVSRWEDSPYRTTWGFLLAAVTRLFYFCIVAVASAAVKARREADAGRIAALERSRELEREILRASELEQQRIGRELHDGLGPHLAAIHFAATFLENDLREHSRPEAGKAGQVREMAGKAISLARGLARGIFPVQMDGTGLSTALEDLARTTSELTGKTVSFHETGNPSVENPEVAMHLFRIAQEAMTNALKHGATERITITLARRQGSVGLMVSDDGKGMDPQRSGLKSVGLRSMQYRARALGSELKIESKPNEGTVVSCDLPDAPKTPSTPAP